MRKSLTFSALRASSTAKYSARAKLGQLRRLERQRAQRNQRTAPLMAGRPSARRPAWPWTGTAGDRPGGGKTSSRAACRPGRPATRRRCTPPRA